MWRLGSKFVNVMSITFVGNLAPGKFIEPRDASPTAYTWRIDLGAFYAIQQIVIPRRPDLGLIYNIDEYLISLPPPSHFFSPSLPPRTPPVTPSHLFPMPYSSSIRRPTLCVSHSIFLPTLTRVQYHTLR